MKRICSLPVVLLIGLLIGGVGTTVAGPAAAATACGPDDVTMVLQFPDGSIRTGCASGDPATGYAALEKAFGKGFITYEPDGSVCRLGGQPSTDPCRGLRPVYWAYFHAKPGAGTWTYSQEGGGTFDSEPGTVEGWRYGDGKAPSIAPPEQAAPAAPTPTKKPGRKPSAKPTGRPTAAVAAPTAVASAATGLPSPTASAPAAPASSAAALPTVAASTTGPSTQADASAATAPAHSATSAPDDGGLSWIWGLALLAVLAAAGGAVALRRRRT